MKEHTEVAVITLTLPRQVLDELNRITHDQIRDKPQYGARARIITALIEELISDVAAGRKKFDQITGRIHEKKHTADLPEVPQ